MATAATKAKTKYNTKSYDQLLVRLPKGDKAKYEEAAGKAGVSLNKFACEALEKMLEINEKTY